MSAPPSMLESWAEILFGIVPWLRRCGVSETTGALELRSPNGRLELEGGGPAVLRVGDGGRLYLQTPGGGAPPVLWYSADAAKGATASWTAVDSGVLPPVGATTDGTTIAPTGSRKVICG